MRALLRNCLPLLVAGCECSDGGGIRKLSAELEVSMTAVDFGEVPLGATKRVRIELKNPGTLGLEISAIDTEAPFGAEPQVTRIQPNEAVDIDAVFSPMEVGRRQSSLIIRSNAKDQPEVTVALSGTGIAGSLVLRPTQIDWTETAIGALRTSEVSLLNLGMAPVEARLVGEGFFRPGHFSLSGTAAITEPVVVSLVARGTSIHLLDYRPLEAGDDDGRIVFEVCGERCGFELLVDASATARVIRLNPAVLDFGKVGVEERVTLQVVAESVGGMPVQITRVATTGGVVFDATPDVVLPAAVTPEAPVGIRVTFQPDSSGVFRGELVVSTNDPTLPEARVPLFGEGQGPALIAEPVIVNFGIARGAGTYRRVLLLRNVGSGLTEVNAISISGDAELSLANLPGLPVRLGGGESVLTDVMFAPARIAEYGAMIRIETADGAPALMVPVEAAMAEVFCDLELIPDRVAFGLISLGATRTIDVRARNRGPDPCSISSAEWRLPEDPALTVGAAAFPRMLATGEELSLSFTYLPTTETESKATYLLVTDDPILPRRAIQLSGRATGEGECFRFSPQNIRFLNVPVNTSARRTADVENIADRDCTIISSGLEPGAHPALTSNAINRVVLPPGARGTIPVDFAPTTATVAQALLRIESDDALAPVVQIPVLGSSISPNICVTPQTLSFGAVVAPTTLSFVISACGVGPVRLLALTWSNPDPEFTLSNGPALPLDMMPQDQVTIDVVYTTADAVADTAELLVRSNDLLEPRIPVTMNGGPEVTPVSAGRFMYYWQINGSGQITRFPLQGPPVPEDFWGPSTGKTCAGCHSLSPDGRYVVLTEIAGAFIMKVIEVATENEVLSNVGGVYAASWNPNVNTNPPYQFVFSDGADLQIASATQGRLRSVRGADTPTALEQFPTWGSGGQIAFVRTNVAFSEPEIYIVDEGGGSAAPLNGASGSAGGYFYPSFSPNGEWVAFSYTPNGSFSSRAAQIRLARSDQSGTVRMMSMANGSNGGASTYPTWSLDGSFISFSSDRVGGRGDWDLWIAPIDQATGMEGPPVNLFDANTPGFEHAGYWSP